MKTNKLLKLACAATILSGISSCTDDVLLRQDEIKQTTSKSELINIKASIPGNNSRITYNEGISSLKMKWSEKDYFSVYNGADNVTTFTINEGEEGNQSANFTGSVTGYETGNKLIALFNHNEDVKVDDDENILLSVQNQTGKLDDRFHYMLGTTTYEEGVAPTFDFKHLVSIFKVNFTAPVGTTFKKVELLGNGIYPYVTLVTTKTPSNMGSEAEIGGTYWIFENHSDTGEIISINGEFTTDENGLVTIYAYVIPTVRIGLYADKVLQPRFVATDTEDNVYINSVVYETKWIEDNEAGKMYNINTPLVLDIDFANENQASGTAEEPYEIANADQLYSMMLRMALHMVNKDHGSYSYCHYKLTNDIELDDRMTWYPIGLYDCTFDGNGHTISGNISLRNASDIGFFASTYNSTVKNLTLDLNIKIDSEGNNEGSDKIGGIVGKLENYSQLINCVNKSDIATNVCFEKVGGLAAEVNNSAIIACVNEGDITLTNPTFIGGLVGNLIENAKIEACYNIGDITVTSTDEFTKYMGDLIGAINYNSSGALMNSCWSNASTTNGGEGIVYGAISGYGSEYVNNCYNVTPSSEQIATMNSSMTNGQYEFAENGVIITKSSSSTETEQ